MPLIPRDQSFFPLFGEQVAIVSQAARTLEAMLVKEWAPALRATELRELEQHGDELNHRILARLEETFVTPFGREEIHDLAEGLDDILDETEEAADLIVLYGLERAPEGAAEQAAILVRQTAVLEQAVAALPTPPELRPFVITIHELEKEGDGLVRALIQRRFDEPGDVRRLLTAVDVHRRIEAAIDRADHVGQLLGRLALQASGRW